MTTPLWCLLIAALMPYVLAGVGAKYRVSQLGSLDNKNPRLQANQLEGVAARAYAAQQNAWEALAVFGTAVIVAHLAGADPGWSATAAVVFVVARVLHPIMYISDQDTLRSLVFGVGFFACLALFGLAATA